MAFLLLSIFSYIFQHEKFTSGLQLSKKPSNSETSTGKTSKSPTKTPTKSPKSPSSSSNAKSGESRLTDGVTSSKELSAKLTESHKAEERIGGETQNDGGWGGIDCTLHLCVFSSFLFQLYGASIKYLFL